MSRLAAAVHGIHPGGPCTVHLEKSAHRPGHPNPVVSPFGMQYVAAHGSQAQSILPLLEAKLALRWRRSSRSSKLRLKLPQAFGKSRPRHSFILPIVAS